MCIPSSFYTKTVGSDPRCVESPSKAIPTVSDILRFMLFPSPHGDNFGIMCWSSFTSFQLKKIVFLRILGINLPPRKKRRYITVRNHPSTLSQLKILFGSGILKIFIFGVASILSTMGLSNVTSIICPTAIFPSPPEKD